MKKLYLWTVFALVFCFMVEITKSFSKGANCYYFETKTPIINNPKRRVEGNQSSLWTPVSSFEDGATYMIRSVSDSNLYWDLTNGSLTNGTELQLYNLNYSHAQKFYFKKQFDYQGHETYRLAPLFAYEKVLRVNSDSENEKIVIASETYTDTHLFSDKMCFIPTYSGSTQFYIASALSGLGKKFTASTIQSGQKIIQKTGPSVLTNDYKWEIVKTDYVGLNVGNKTYINGTQETRYVARVPYVGEYVIETFDYGASSLDTFLRLNRDSDNTQVAFDDDSGTDYNAKIIYNFTTIEEFSIFVRGYSNNEVGYCYLVLRPLKTIYMTGTYDIDNRHVDCVTCLNNTKTYCRDLGYFCEVYGNLNHGTIFNDTDWENTTKMDRDYYVFNGHGGGDGTQAVYFDGSSPDWISYYDIPNLQNAGLVVWMACGSAHYSYLDDEQRYTCLANECVLNGADYSLGYEGSIWPVTIDCFVPKLFESLLTNSLTDSIYIASQYALQMNLIWYIYVNNQQDDIINPVLISQNNVRGETVDIPMPNFDTIRNNYNTVDGFICKKTDSFLDLSNIKEMSSSFISDLYEKWDDVVLFATANNNTVSAYAVCTDNENIKTAYYDLMTQNPIQSYIFEEMMRVDDSDSSI